MSEELNAEQLRAVRSTAPDLFIAAGAGTGKTRVLTEIFMAQAESRGFDALDDVVTITFTDKAAGELADRVRRRLAADPSTASIAREVDRAWISTIHGMCARILRRHPLEAGIDPAFTIGTEVELGVLRTEAFETVALEALEAGGPSAALVRAYQPDRLMSRVVNVYEHTRSFGGAQSSVSTFRVSPDRLSSARAALEQVIVGYGTLERRPQTVERNTAALAALVDAIEAYAGGRLDADGLARTAGATKQDRRGSDEAKLLAEAAIGHVEDVRLMAAQQAAAPFEQAFLGLVDAFSEAYERARREAQLMDFGDLQELTERLLRSDPRLAQRYAHRFKLVMVDEFQDTDPGQVSLIGHIAPDGFVTVGDERQSIYRFRHADVGVFRSKQARASIVCPLVTNYRSSHHLIRFFNEIFSRKPFWDDFLPLCSPEGSQQADEGDGTPVTALFVDTAVCGDDKPADEASVLADHIKALVDAGTPMRDVVILLRAMTRAEVFAAALRARGLEAFVASGGTYFGRPEVIDIEMLLRIAANTRDDEAAVHVLAGRMTGLSEDAMARIRLEAGSAALWETCRACSDLGLAARDVERLERTLGVVDWFRRSRGSRELSDLIHEACERLEYDLTLFAMGPEGARSWANVLKLARMAGQYEQHALGDPSAFLEYLQLKRESDGKEALAAFAVEGIDAVCIMSVHAAKGLEFPVVAVADLGSCRRSSEPIVLATATDPPLLGMRLPPSDPEGDSVPTLGYEAARDAEAAADLEEEKRIFYVACTRAERALVLCGRTAFDSPADGATGIGWVREALGFAAAGSITAGLRVLGAAAVEIVTGVPRSCEIEPDTPTTVDPSVLRLAAAEPRQSPAKEQDPIRRISYSGLSTYRSCPYRYYATRVLGLGTVRSVQDARDATTFGSVVHAALSLVARGDMPGADRLEALCRAAGGDIGLAYRVASVVSSYLGSETAREFAGLERVASEAPFAVPVDGVLLEGAIDLIGWSGARAVIVDYKTGDSGGGAGASDRYRTQAGCYAIAAIAMGATSVSVRFVEIEQDCRTTRFEFDSGDDAALRADVRTTLDSITRGRFPTLERYDPLTCPSCPAYGSLCPVKGPRR